MMSEYICTCHCGGAMFYRHLHDPICDLSVHGEEAPQSKEAQLEADNAALREQVKAQSDSLLGQYRIVAEMQDRAITVERERDALRLKVQEYNSALDAMTARYVVLETLVKALPVLDMRFDSVAVGPLGWTVGGVTFGKVTEANAYSALLQYRATLAAQEAGKEDVSHE